MPTSQHLQQYASLLRIRRQGIRRNAIVIGLLFGASVAVGLVWSVLSPLNPPSLFLSLATLLVIGLGLVSELSHLEMLKQIEGLLDELNAR